MCVSLLTSVVLNCTQTRTHASTNAHGLRVNAKQLWGDMFTVAVPLAWWDKHELWPLLWQTASGTHNRVPEKSAASILGGEMWSAGVVLLLWESSPAMRRSEETLAALTHRQAAQERKRVHVRRERWHTGKSSNCWELMFIFTGFRLHMLGFCSIFRNFGLAARMKRKQIMFLLLFFFF